ncbi:MAG: hypothetical protein ACXVJT_15730, partial [Thermoanaerobaculia bacterium]
MERVRAGRWWVAGFSILLILSSFAIVSPASAASAAPPRPVVYSEDDEFSQLIAQLRSDLSRSKSRENARRG